jgi:hypothetical protein
MIPGTLNSASIEPLHFWTYLVWPWVQNQDKSISTQLQLGVRYIDLRVSQENDRIFCSHRFLTSTSLIDALNQIRCFLWNHPTEFVLLYIRADFDNLDHTDFKKVSQIVFDELNFKSINTSYIYRGDTFKRGETNVADLQGKVVLFHEFPRVIMTPTTTETSRSPAKIISFDYSLTMDLVQMWNAPLDQALTLGMQKLDDFFNYTDRSETYISGIVCDVFTLGTRKGAAEIMKNKIRNLKTPSNKNPGIVALDFFDEKTADALFDTFLAEV